MSDPVDHPPLRKQLNVWVLGKIGTLNDADLLQYDRRRDRIAELQKELESMARAALVERAPTWRNVPSTLQFS